MSMKCPSSAGLQWPGPTPARRHTKASVQCTHTSTLCCTVALNFVTLHDLDFPKEIVSPNVKTTEMKVHRNILA